MPLRPVLGLIEVIVGPITVNGTVLLAPPGVETLTFLGADTEAFAEMVKVVVIVVESGLMVNAPTVMPPPAFTVVPVAVKFVPISVTGTAVPRKPVLGVIEVSVGVAGVIIEKLSGLLVPTGVVTVTFRAVSPAFGAMIKFTVTVLSLTTVKPLTVTPPPVMFTAVAPVRFVPVRVAATVVPRAPSIGEIDASVGIGAAIWNSMAPISILFFKEGSGLGLP